MAKSSIMFIDYDNLWITSETNYGIDLFSLNFVDKISDFLNEKDYKLNEVYAYGNYDNGKMSRDRHQSRLQTLGVQTKHCRNGKDSADIAIVCDLLEKLYCTSVENEVYIIATCDKDIIPLINKIKAKGKSVIIITFTVNIDWDVIRNYGDVHYWIEEILGIPYEEPKLKEKITSILFCEALKSEIELRKMDINYSLFSNKLQKKFNACRGDIDCIKDSLIGKEVEIYSYDYEGKTYHDGIRFITPKE